MAKRSLAPSIEITAVDDNGFVVEYNGKQYYVNGAKDYIKYYGNPQMEWSIIHNYKYKAMLNIEDIRLQEDVLRQEINPLKFKDVAKWVIDE